MGVIVVYYVLLGFRRKEVFCDTWMFRREDYVFIRARRGERRRVG